MRRVVYRLFFMAGISVFLLNLSNCNRQSNKTQYYKLNPVSDAGTLPYEFVVKDHFTFINNVGIAYVEERVPLDLFGDGVTRMYAVQSGWTLGRDISSVVFYESASNLEVIDQENISTSKISSHLSCDIDDDDTLEVLITYIVRDTAWLEIISPVRGRVSKHPIAVCRDRDNNGLWDGRVVICEVADINNDGAKDVLASADAGYDLLPRKLVCIDIKNDEELWHFDISGFIPGGLCRILKSPETETIYIVGGVASKGNRVQTEYMNDEYSYIFVLKQDGSLHWVKQTGNIYSTSYFEIGDYDNDGTDDILSAQNINVAVNQKPAGKRNRSVIFVYDQNGGLIDSIMAGDNREFRAFEKIYLDRDSGAEYIATFTDSSMAVFDHQLDIAKECQLYTMGSPIACRDFLGTGENHIMISTRDDKTWLVDNNFAPLAKLDLALHSHLFNAYPAQAPDRGLHLIAGAEMGTATFHLSLRPTPWFSVFFRKPWLASLAAAVPLILILGLVIVYTFRIRHKNRLINRARNELLATQEKLVEAEKYAQAKDIAGGFAHEVRNALFPARSWLSRLKKSAGYSDAQAEQIAMVNKAVARAINVTTLISHYTKLETERKHEKVEVADLLREVMHDNSLRLEEQGVRIDISCPDNNPVSVNREHLYIVFNNLLLNSLDALTDKKYGGEISVQCLYRTDTLIIDFEDNGTGISEENLGRVFDTFYSTKPSSGTGLGLSMAKKIVEMYGGEMSVTSRPGSGAKFTIKLDGVANSKAATSDKNGH